MKKSIIAAIIAITVVILIILCIVVVKTTTNNDNADPYYPYYEQPTWRESEKEYFKIIAAFKGLDGTLVRTLKETKNYRTPLKKLTPYSYSDLCMGGTIKISAFTQKAPRSKNSNSLSFGEELLCLFHYCSVYPLQHIKVIDDDHVLAVYRLQDKYTDSEIYAYFVFEKECYTVTESDRCVPGTYEDWRCRGEYYLARKANSYEQFAHLKVGDVLTDSELFDLAIQCDTAAKHYGGFDLINPDEIANADPNFVYVEEACLLKEGMLRIVLKSTVCRDEFMNNESRGFREIAEIEFYPYGTEVPEGFTITILPYTSLIELP